MPSRNDRAPMTYKRRFVISRHAIERFRERVDEEFASRSDHDLGNLLDEKLRHPEVQYQVHDPRAPEALTQLYGITTRRSGTFFAVVREDTAVTVLDEDMAKRNFAEHWKPTLNTPFADLRAKIDVPVAKPSKPVLDVTAIPKPPVPVPSDDAVAAAGARYALALKEQRVHALALERARATLAEAEAALEKATAAVEAANEALLRATNT